MITLPQNDNKVTPHSSSLPLGWPVEINAEASMLDALTTHLFSSQLPDTLAMTHLLTPVMNNLDTQQPVIDAVFSKRAQEDAASAEGAHVIVAGETLYLHGFNLPNRATALLEPLNNPYQTRHELETYGWNTLKSICLPDCLCEGEYRLSLLGEENAQSNAAFLTVRPLHAPQYVSQFKGMSCLQTSLPGGVDHPYLLGIAIDDQGWKTVSCGAYADVKANTRVQTGLELGGKYKADGYSQPTCAPEEAVFHLALGSANNFRHGLLGKRWDIDSYDVLTPEGWGNHKAAELWSHIVTDRAFLGEPDLTQPALSVALKEYVQETITESGDTLLGTVTLIWTHEEVEAARQANGAKAVAKIFEVRCGASRYRLEFQLRRVHAE